MEHILSMQHVTKNYGRFCLQDITLALPKGCIMGLIGENGAGKDKELIREERYRQIEALLEKACETARMNGMTLEELLDIMTLLYKEE